MPYPTRGIITNSPVCTNTICVRKANSAVGDNATLRMKANSFFGLQAQPDSGTCIETVRGDERRLSNISTKSYNNITAVADQNYKQIKETGIE